MIGKKIFIPFLVTLLMSGCAKQPDDALYLHPTIVLPQQDMSMKPIQLTIKAIDNRQDKALSKVVRDNRLISLTDSVDTKEFFRDMLEKQMRIRGYVTSATADNSLTLYLDELYANVQQGSFRYMITTKASIRLVAKTANGSEVTKTLSATNKREGIMDANKPLLTEILNNIESNIIASMANDNSIHQFLKQSAY